MEPLELGMGTADPIKHAIPHVLPRQISSL